MTEETETGGTMKRLSLQAQEPEQKPKKNSKPAITERLCFVITKNKSNSWADDLYACNHIAELNRVYN